MNPRRFLAALVLVLSLVLVSDLHALANRVFVSARSGSDINGCDNIATPCQTFAGAVVQLNPGGEAIVLDSGGYGAVTITKALTIEAPPGVLAFIHPSSGVAVTINAGAGDTVVLRGLVLNGGASNGIVVNTVGGLVVEDCSISGFASDGLHMAGAGRLDFKNSDLTGCGGSGVLIDNPTGAVTASIDHCHLDNNGLAGFLSNHASPGSATTTATHTTANNNVQYGWNCGFGGSGIDILNLEFCSGSGNSGVGLQTSSPNPSSAVRYSNCVFSNNGLAGVGRVIGQAGVAESRGNNSVAGNGASSSGAIGSFPPM